MKFMMRFLAVTYHAATEIMRSVRTPKWLYIGATTSVYAQLALTLMSYSKQYLVDQGLADRSYVREELYDVIFDPPSVAILRQSMRQWSSCVTALING